MSTKFSHVHWVKKLTGWDKEDLRKARKYGDIKFTYNEIDGYRYDLNSIPERLIINKKAASSQKA